MPLNGDLPWELGHDACRKPSPFSTEVKVPRARTMNTYDITCSLLAPVNSRRSLLHMHRLRCRFTHISDQGSNWHFTFSNKLKFQGQQQDNRARHPTGGEEVRSQESQAQRLFHGQGNFNSIAIMTTGAKQFTKPMWSWSDLTNNCLNDILNWIECYRKWGRPSTPGSGRRRTRGWRRSTRRNWPERITPSGFSFSSGPRNTREHNNTFWVVVKACWQITNFSPV